MVYLATPASGQILYGPTNVALTASAQSTVAAVSRVEFFANGVLVSQDSLAPFAGAWSGAGFGDHSLFAVTVFEVEVAPLPHGYAERIEEPW